MTDVTFHGLLKSSFVHFIALGGLIFVVFAMLDDTPSAPPPDAIVLTAPEAARLVDQFTATWRRPPTAQELEALMQSWAVEEANVREALELGLDRGDAVIRQRLNLKMQFLSESGAAVLEPEDAELQAYLDANPERFMQPPDIAFEQVLLPEEGAASEIRVLLENGADPATLGVASLLPSFFPMTPAPVIDRTFGAGFDATLAALPLNSWQGPVPSGYGQHLVRVTDRSDPTLPPLSEIRTRVEAEWRADRTKTLRESYTQAMLARYSVTLPDAGEVLNQ